MFDDAFDDLISAEDFLEYFEVPYNPQVVQVNRLHILQRFHDYLGENEVPGDEAAARTYYTACLTRAYEDFVHSDARTEKVFAVFHQGEAKAPEPAFVSAESLLE